MAYRRHHHKKKTQKNIVVKNVEGTANTTAEIVVQNKIDFVPKVSVIIPVYNVEKYIGECLDSVINQTLKEIEIICVDDGSTDNSLEIIKEYAKKDSRITVLKQKNCYAGVARNAGLSVAKGEWVHFLDSDDWIETEGYENIYNILIKTRVDFIKFKNNTYDNVLKKYVKDQYTEIGCIDEQLFDKILIAEHKVNTFKMPDSPWSGIYNRQFLNKHNIKFDNLKCANDSSFFFKCLVASSTFYIASERLVNYRVNNNKSLVGIRSKNFDCQINQFYRIEKYIQDCSEELKKNIRIHLLRLIMILYNKYIQSELDAFYKQKLFKEVSDFLLDININWFYENNDLLKFYNRIIKQKKSKISVIIPVFNASEYLKQCLDSVLSQTLKDIEVICVNDGSTDDSIQILNTYFQNDDRIVLINRENKGVAFSRNEALDRAHGEFVIFLDSDDYYPNKNVLKSLYDNAVKNNALICGGNLLMYNNGKERVSTDKKQVFCNNEFIKYQNYQYDYGFTRYIFNTKFLKDHNIKFPLYTYYEDPVFFVNAMVNAKEFYTINNDVYVYRFGEKVRTYTEEKVYHLLLGLKDVLEICVKNQLDKLYDTTLVRIKSEYKKIIAEFESDRIKSVKQEIMDLCLSNVKNRYKNDKTKAKVSIVLPIYNAEPYLKECLDSCINQTLKDIEIICVNDGSTDNSLNIVKEYAKKDKRIKYIDKPNAGYGQTMNCGMALASGEYIGIVEPDDFIKLDMYETLYKKAKSENFDIVKSDYCTFDKKSSQYVNIVSKDLYNINISRHTNRQYIGFTINPTGIFKRDFINKYHLCFNETPGAAHQDIGFAMLTAFFAESATFINQDFYQYRQDNDNSSMHRFAKPNIMIDEYNFIYNKLIEYPIVFNEVKDLFYQRRHNSLMYFGKNRISDVDKVYFWQRVQAIYQADKTKNFLDVLTNNQKKEAIDIVNQRKVIPVCFSTDDNYIPYLSVAIASLKVHMSDKYKYVIYILYTDITSQNINMLLKQSDENCEIFFINVSQYIDLSMLYTSAHFSKEMYYRLLISELLPFYSKILYLDCDLLVTKDVSELYHLDISNNLVGAIVNPPNKGFTNYKQQLSLDENRYFNSGVLLINVDEFNRSKIKETIFNLLNSLPKKLMFPDQDLLNIVCQHKVKFLDERWNFQWGYLLNPQPLVDNYKSKYNEISKEPYIIHYTTGNKAWNTKHPLSDIWWNYAKKSPFYYMLKNPSSVKQQTVSAQGGVKCEKKKHNKLKAYLLFPLYLYKLSKAKKKLLRLTCKNIWQQLIKNNVNVFSLNKGSLSGLILKYNPQSEYVKKNLKYITNAVYDKCKHRKKHRFLGVKFYTHNKHKELMHLMQYTLTRVNQVESQIQSLKVPVLNNSNQINVIQKTNTTIGIQLDKSLKELSVLNNEIFKIKDDCQRLKQNDVNTQEILVNSKKDIDGIYQMILDVQTNLSDVQQKVFGTKEDVSHVRKTLVTTKGDVANVHKTVLRIKEGISDVQKTVCDTKEDIANVQQTAVSTRDNIANVQQTVVSIRDNIANVQQTAVSTRDNIANVQQTVVSTKEDIANVQQTAVNMSKTVDAMKDSALNTQKIVGHLNYQSQRNFHELNYADLLHDTICESSWLKNKTLSLFGWAANYSFIYLLYRVLDKVMPQNILEMGLGQTTKLTAQYVAHKNPSARLNVCEHNQDWINIYQSELPQSDNMTINHFDLTFFEYEGKQNDKYKDITQKFESEKFDLIIVDGPVGGGKNLPRSNILELIQNDNLANDFVIVFDDSERNGEQNTIKQTRALLQEKGVDFSEFDRNGIKNQHIITSQSRSFVQFL